MYKKIHISLDFDKFISANHGEGTTCIAHQVHELTDIHNQYKEGFPKSYCLANTIIHQRWWTDKEVDYDKIGDQLGVEVITISSILQPPGNTIPWHRDTFYQIKKRHPNRTNEKIVRANIFLEDWKTGHFVQYNDVVSTHWKQGEGHLWDQLILHLGANNGMENKYTLQVSGFLKN